MSTRSRWSLAAFGIAVLLEILFLIAGQGGLVHPESAAFLRIYTDPARPFWQIIFDPQLTDWGLYQARELSYLADSFDAWFILKSIRLGCVHFYSLSCVLILLACVFVQQRGFQRDFPHLPPVTALLISVGFILAPCCRSLIFFRSAKPLATLAATLICFAGWHLFRTSAEEGRKSFLLIVCVLFLAPLADRQGMFLTALAAGFIALALIVLAFPAVRDRLRIDGRKVFLLKRLGGAAGAALCFATIYDLFLAPALIRWLNGYSPSFAYQQLGAGWLQNFGGGGTFLCDNVGFFFLRIPSVVCCGGGIVLLLLWGLWWIYDFRKAPEKIVPGTLFVLSLAALFLCGMLMTFRHPLMLREDVIHSGYFMPMLAILLFFAAASCEVARASEKFANMLTILLVFSCVSAGIAPLVSGGPEQGHLKFYSETAPTVRKALADPSFDAESNALPYGSLKLIRHFRDLK